MALQSTPSAHDAAHAPQSPPVVLNGRLLEGNRRIPLNLDWVEEVRVNTSAVERRAATTSRAAPSRKRIRQHGCFAPSPAWTSPPSAATTPLTASAVSAPKPAIRCSSTRRGSRHRGAAPHRRRRLRLSRLRRDRRQSPRRHPASPSPPSPPDFPPASRRSPSAWRRFAAPSKPAPRNRHRHHARPRLQRRVAGPL